MTDSKHKSTLTADADILSKLTELGGGRVTDDSLVFEGNQLVVPERMSVVDAIHFLRDYEKQNEQEFSISRVFDYRPWDGAAAFERAVKRVTGFTGFGKTVRSFFGSRPPEYRTVNTGATETAQVPWGQIEIPMLEATATLTGTFNEHGEVFAIIMNAPKKHKAAVEGLFRVIQEELETGSIYRHKAIDGAATPNFIDLSGVDTAKVVYATDVMEQLEANVWSMLRHADKLEALGVPMKRAVLFEGDYGTGKTLAAFRTAKIANEEGWTFIYGRPGKDNYEEVLKTAELYQPAVVFFEDIDTVSSGENADRSDVARLLDLFDGIQSKGTRLLCVMTTNHADRIHKGMVRPGRLDAVIHIGALDGPATMELITKCVDPALLGELDEAAIAEAFKGFVPAFAREAIERALRYAVSRTEGKDFTLTTRDFVAAANGLRPQLQMMQEASETTADDTVGLALEKVLRDSISGVKVVDSDDDFHRFTIKA